MKRSLTALILFIACLHSALLAAAADPEIVTGRVIDADGRPEPAAQVAILESENTRQLQCPESGLSGEGCIARMLAAGIARAVATADASGRFTLRVPGGLTARDMVWAEGRDADGKVLRTSWPVAPNRALPTATLGDIELNQRLDLTVVIQADGKPIAGAEVDFGNNSRMRTDQTGKVFFHIMATPPRGEQTFHRWHVAYTVRAPGFAIAEWAGGVPMGASTQVIELVRESMLAGRIVDARGRPVARAEVVVVPLDGEPGVSITVNGNRAPERNAGPVTTDATGGFTLGGLRPAERYLLHITPEDAALSRGAKIITTDGSDVVITLRPVPDHPLMDLDAAGARVAQYLATLDNWRPEVAGRGFQRPRLDIASDLRVGRWTDGARTMQIQISRADSLDGLRISHQLYLSARQPPPPHRVLERIGDEALLMELRDHISLLFTVERELLEVFIDLPVPAMKLNPGSPAPTEEISTAVELARGVAAAITTATVPR